MKAVCAHRCELRNQAQLAQATIASARKRILARCADAPPTRRNGSELQRPAPREFAPQKLHEEQQATSLDAAADSIGETSARRSSTIPKPNGALRSWRFHFWCTMDVCSILLKMLTMIHRYCVSGHQFSAILATVTEVNGQRSVTI